MEENFQAELHPIEDVLIPLQSAIRQFLLRKQLEAQMEVFEEPEERDPVQAVREVAISEIPQLSPAATVTLSALLPFSYDFPLFGTQRKGPVLLDDGSVYIGEWKNSRRMGRGECYTREGGLLEGYWCNGLHYKGRIVYSNGSYFAGEFWKMARQGHGTLVEAQGLESYVGSWQRDMKCGFGEETMADGSVYSGEFQQGLKSGSGVLRWPNNEYYDGEFLLGKQHGHGTYVWSSTKSYEGSWVVNHMDGLGTLVDGETLYIGNFRQDKKHGKGLLRWGGKEYEGDFQAGKMHGFGWLRVQGKPSRYFKFHENQRKEELPPPI